MMIMLNDDGWMVEVMMIKVLRMMLEVMIIKVSRMIVGWLR